MSTPHEPGDGKQPSTPSPAADKRPEAAGTPEKKAGPAQKSAPGPQEGGSGAPKPAAASGKPAQGAPAPTSQTSGDTADRTPEKDSAGQKESPASKPGDKPVQTPPWQRGQQGRPSSPPPNGSAKPAGPAQPVASAKQAPSRPVITGTAAPKPPQGEARPARPVITGTAAPKPPAADRRDTAKAKAAAIDGPTRSIARSDLPKDMPDLSAVPRATHSAAPTARKASPAAVAAAVADEGESLRATVQLRRIDPWSTLKVSLVISVALFFVWMVAVGLLYIVLDGMGVWDRLNNAFTEIITDSSSEGLVTSGQVFGYSALIGVMNVVLFTALATIGSFIYNLCSDLVGGVQVTLADPD